MIIEIIIILFQASRATQSHFNTQTGFDAILFGIMGLMILLNAVAVLAVLFLFLFKKTNLDRAYLRAIRLGLIVFLMSNYLGKVMIDHMVHAVGVADGGKGLPFVNWSTEGGDLRVAHFMGLHAIQIIPLFAYYLQKKTRLSLRSRIISICAFVILYATIFRSLYFQAMGGYSLLSS